MIASKYILFIIIAILILIFLVKSKILKIIISNKMFIFAIIFILLAVGFLFYKNTTILIKDENNKDKIITQQDLNKARQEDEDLISRFDK